MINEKQKHKSKPKRTDNRNNITLFIVRLLVFVAPFGILGLGGCLLMFSLLYPTNPSYDIDAIPLTPRESHIHCCGNPDRCGVRTSIDGTQNYLVWNDQLSFDAYACFADGKPTDIFRYNEDTTLYTENGQVVVHDWWSKQLRYYDGETLTLVDTIHCEDNACTAER